MQIKVVSAWEYIWSILSMRYQSTYTGSMFPPVFYITKRIWKWLWKSRKFMEVNLSASIFKISKIQNLFKNKHVVWTWTSMAFCILFLFTFLPRVLSCSIHTYKSGNISKMVNNNNTGFGYVMVYTCNIRHSKSHFTITWHHYIQWILLSLCIRRIDTNTHTCHGAVQLVNALRDFFLRLLNILLAVSSTCFFVEHA